MEMFNCESWEHFHTDVVVGHWNSGTLEQWDSGTLGQWDSVVFRKTVISEDSEL